MIVLDAIGRSLAEAFAMLWATLWALVLGFSLSGAVQTFVTRSRMRASLGDHRPKTVAKASFFGMVSSSCSYAASALAKSLFAGGADFTASMAFMVASTNLVVELGAVMWLLLGWQFAVAEFVGGTIMITLLVAVLPRVIPAVWLGQAREVLRRSDASSSADQASPAGHEDSDGSPDPVVEVGDDSRVGRIRTMAGWADAAGYTISDLTMLRRELVAGFLIAGFIAELVPSTVWSNLFIVGHGPASSIENVLLGPLLAMLSFVCSVGNVPLAAALWHGGISFGGVLSFVFADLLTVPLLLIYRRYYGTRITLRLLGVFWAVMSLSGLITEYLFRAVGLVPSPHTKTVVATGVHLNYTTVLNVIALLAFASLYWLYRNRDRFGSDGDYAKDVVCGMQVERAHAPATTSYLGQTYSFCSDRCRVRFVEEPDSFAGGTDSAAASPATDAAPVGRALDATPAHHVAGGDSS